MSELEPVIQRYLDGQATSEEVARLNTALLIHGEARQALAELAQLDCALAELAASWEKPQAKIVRLPVRRLLAAAAAVALAALGAWWLQRPFALVAGTTGLDAMAPGTKLRGEPHELSTGTVEMVTRRGAKVVIEAPAAFQFESAQKLRLLHGRVAAEVPPAAKGFTVLTPTGRAVDLGTKFGVDVPRQGEAEIHVFQGEVIAESSGGPRQSLRGGEAFALQTGAGAVRELRSSAFIRPEEVAALHAGLAAGQQRRSAAALEELRRDPALIVLLDFEGEALPEGQFRVTQGRWPGSHAPEFVNAGDHMRVDAGGDRAWPQLTLAAWVRLDRLGAPFQSLMHTDGWDASHLGQVHWMVTRKTTMRLALFGNTLAPGAEETEKYPDSRTPVLPEQGRWVHLATVYDSEARTVRFYLNGQFDRETRQAIAYPARLGAAQIGNWDRKDRKLSGRVDELVLLGRAMSDGEVRALYDAGNPYRE